MEITNLPEQYKKIWQESLSLLEQGRPDDAQHAKETVEYILNYEGGFQFDMDIMIPVAIMHDIGHSTILPEHFRYITGGEKIANGKLVHMLAGAKIAKNILEKVGYDSGKSQEIVDIISMHDADQLKGIDMDKVYQTDNSKVFHDIDALDRYTEIRFQGMKKMFKSEEEMIAALEKALDMFLFEEFRTVAKKRMEELKKNHLN